MKYHGIVCSRVSRIKLSPVSSEVKSFCILRNLLHPEHIHRRGLPGKHRHNPCDEGLFAKGRQGIKSSFERFKEAFKDSYCLGISSISLPSQIPGGKYTDKNVFNVCAKTSDASSVMLLVEFYSEPKPSTVVHCVLYAESPMPSQQELGGRSSQKMCTHRSLGPLAQ